MQTCYLRLRLQRWSRAYGSAPELTKQTKEIEIKKKQIPTPRVTLPPAPLSVPVCFVTI
jgi:hypothetical protein